MSAIFRIRHVVMLSSLLLILAGCYKDEVAEADLTTNPLDQDYEGEPLLEFLGDSTFVQVDSIGLPIDTLLAFKFHVRTDLFPSASAFQPFGVQVSDGTEYTGPPQAPDNDEAFVLHRHVVYGNNYCMDVSIKLLGSSTRSYRFCADADL